MQHRAPMTDLELAAMRQRNEQRARAAAAALGSRYALHPANSPQRQLHRPMLPGARLGTGW